MRTSTAPTIPPRSEIGDGLMKAVQSPPAEKSRPWGQGGDGVGVGKSTCFHGQDVWSAFTLHASGMSP